MKFLNLLVCTCFLSLSANVLTAAELASKTMPDEAFARITDLRGNQYHEYAFILPYAVLEDTLYFYSNGDFAIESVLNEPTATITDGSYVEAGKYFYATLQFQSETATSNEINHYGILGIIPYGICYARYGDLYVGGFFYLMRSGIAAAPEAFSLPGSSLTFADLCSN